MKKILFAPILAIGLVLVGGGCADARDKWTEGDREVNNQSLQGVRLQLQAIDALASHADGLVAIGLAAIGADLVIIESNLLKIEVLHGPPAEVKPFSEKNSKDAQDKATEEHSKRDLLGWVTLIGGYLAAATGVAAAALNLPIVGPWLSATRIGQFIARTTGGPLVKAGQDAMKGISQARAEAQNGQPLTAAKLIEIVHAAASPTSAKIADKVSDQIEDKLGLNLPPVTTAAGS